MRVESVAITQAELLDALLTATQGAGPDDARTVQELVAESGLPAARVRQALQRLNAAGRLQPHRVRRPDLSGREQWVPAYTVRPV